MGDSLRPLRVLALDGGGIRGLSSLYILQRILESLEHKAGRASHEHILPCQIFDMIAGTSTGGLIAIMLGTLKMDIQTCIDEYIRLSPIIFPVESLIQKSSVVKIAKMVVGRNRFNAEPFEREIKDLVAKRLEGSPEGEDTKMRFEASKDNRSPACKVFVCTTTVKQSSVRLMRTYNCWWESTENCAIWQACRATSAAPTFFDPIVLGRPPMAYVDGGLRNNNPILVLDDEIHQLWPGRQIGCIISIGTGLLSAVDVGRTLAGLMKTLSDLASNSKNVADGFRQSMENKDGIEQRVYFRFSVDHGLENVGLEEWKELDRTKIATQDYTKEQQGRILMCADQLLEPKDFGTRWNKAFEISFSLEGMPAIGRFTPRIADLECLEGHLLLLKEQKRRKVFVLYGLGGIGKTQLAIEYARRYKIYYSAIFWLKANTRESLLSSFSLMASQITRQASPDPDGRFEDPGKYGTKVVEDVNKWLSLDGNDKWLMIYDNCDSLESENGGYDLREFFPKADHGSIIITTRRSQLSYLATADKRLEKMSESQSIDVLENILGKKFDVSRRSEWHEGLEEIIERLDGLPLALFQAGTYIRQTGVSFATYLESYSKSWDTLTKKMPEIQEYLNGSIQTTWNISFEKVREKNENAAKLLELWAYFDYHDIWTDLILNGNRGPDVPEWFRNIARVRDDLIVGITLLLDFSLIQTNLGSGTYSLHPVVHDWLSLLSRDKKQELARIAIIAIAFTAEIDEHDSNDWIIQRRILPHADKILLFLQQQGHSFFLPWEYKHCPGRLSDRMTSISEKTWNESEVEHPLRRLGWLYFRQDQFEKAKFVLRTALDQLEKVPGINHPTTIRTAFCLAFAHMGLKEFDAGEDLATRAWRGNLDIFGPADKWTLITTVGLAVVYHQVKKTEEAISLLKAVLEAIDKHPGMYDVLQANALDHLGLLYWEKKLFKESEDYERQSLNLKEKTQGSDHPNTLRTAENLAGRYRDRKLYNEAEVLYRRLATSYERIYGKDHERTVEIYRRFGNMLGEQDRLAEAEHWQRQALISYKNIDGLQGTRALSEAQTLATTLFLQCEQTLPKSTHMLGKIRGVRFRNSEVPSHQVLELARLAEQYGTTITGLLPAIGRILCWCGDAREARIAFQYEGLYENGMWAYLGLFCDGCQKEPLGAERWVCERCVGGIDLCKNCRSRYKDRRLELSSCFDHPFLEVSLPPAGSATKTGKWEESLQQWLRRITEKYSYEKQESLRRSKFKVLRTPFKQILT